MPISHDVHTTFSHVNMKELDRRVDALHLKNRAEAWLEQAEQNLEELRARTRELEEWITSERELIKRLKLESEQTMSYIAAQERKKAQRNGHAS